jgi:hypothetical protein
MREAGEENIKRNRLGMLRKAIEEDWPALEVSRFTTKKPTAEQGREFAAHFYAGYWENEDEPIAEPSAGDIEPAREKEFHPESSLILLKASLRCYGDGYYRLIKARSEDFRRQAMEKVVQEHFVYYRGCYMAYMRIVTICTGYGPKARPNDTVFRSNLGNPLPHVHSNLSDKSIIFSRLVIVKETSNRQE